MLKFRLSVTNLLNLRVEGVEIKEQIDARIIECFHASIVICIWIDVIHANRICTKLLHQVCISCALRSVDKRVIRHQLVRNTYIQMSVPYEIACQGMSRPHKRLWSLS